MPSFAVDVLLGVILIGGVYILFGRSAQTSAKSSSKKKKRSKASKSKAASTAADGSQQDVKNVAKASPKPSFPSSKPEGLAPAKQTSKDGRSSTTGQGIGQRTRDANDGKLVPAENGTSGPSDSDDVEFPSLSSSYAARASQGTSSNGKNPAKSQPKPLAERRAKTLPKTAVDDMVEKDDALQGEQKFSRTMRIVKPQADKPLLLDDDEVDSWSDGHREARQDSAWQSVPVSSRKSSTIRLSSSHSVQPSNQVVAGRSVPGLPELTKKQRQNARKAAEAKAAKETAEQERLQRLAQHKRSLENERMNEQYKQKGKSQAPHVQKSKREELGGGMQAKVYDGQLIWE